MKNNQSLIRYAITKRQNELRDNLDALQRSTARDSAGLCDRAYKLINSLKKWAARAKAAGL